MGEKIRGHIRSNVWGMAAMFVALTGTAYATHPGGANTINSEDIINGEVKTADIRDANITRHDLGIGSVNSAKAVDDSLTGTDILNESLTSDDIADGSLAEDNWHEVGVTPEPAFNDSGVCSWSNYSTDPNHNSVAFLRDRLGFVHLKGLARATGDLCDFNFSADRLIFNLPAGYQPAKREVHVALTRNALGRVNVDGPSITSFLGAGAVAVNAPPTTVDNAKDWVSLDGITFRCAPSGSNGCP